MKYFLMIGILLLLIGTVTGTAIAEGNTIWFDLPGYIIGEYPIGYSTAISDHQTINFGYTYYSTNVFNNIYSAKQGRDSGYAIEIGITNYFHKGYEGLNWEYDIGYVSEKNPSTNDNDLNWLRGTSYAIGGSLGYTKNFDNGFTLGYDIRIGLDLNEHQRMFTNGFDFTTGYSW
jgi:hypothetical protein